MQALRKLPALLIICVLTSVAALASTALGTAASEQMAAKRRISLQFQQDMLGCEKLDGVAEERCEHQAHAWAEVAKAELETRRQRLAQGRQTREMQVQSQHKIAQARCNALSGRVRERCTGGAARTAS